MFAEQKSRSNRLLFNMFVWISLMLCGTQQVTADTINFLDLTLEQLLSVKVHSASKKEELIGNTPVAVYAITDTDIEKSGVTTIPDALRMVPGVSVARSDSNSWAISIRGFNSVLSNKLLVMIDGRTIYNPVFGGVLWEAHDLMLEDIKRIEVIRGPGGTLWGANAVNGVINIITKHTRETQGKLLSATYGNEEKGILSARYGGSFDVGTYRVYAKAFERDASIKPAVEGAAADTYDSWNGLRTGFRIDWNDSFVFLGDAYRTRTQQLRLDHYFVEPFAAIEQQWIVYEGMNLLGRWSREMADSAQLSVQAYVNWTKRDEPFNFIDERTTYDIDIQYNFAPRDRHEIITGAGFRFLTDDKQGNRNVQFSPQRKKTNIYNVFIQDKITLIPDFWFFTIGTKIENSEYSGTEIQPNARLHWQLEQNQTLWMSLSRAVRTPTPIERDHTSTLGKASGLRVAFAPNEDFQSEKLTAFEVGYRNQLTSRLSFDIASFYNDYKQLTTFQVGGLEDLILVDNQTDPLHFLLPVTFENDMKGSSSGVEMAWTWTASEQLNLSMHYSYLHMSLEAIDPQHESAEGMSPRHQFGARVFWDINENWSLGALANYVDRLPAISLNSYWRFDLNLSTRINRQLKFDLVGQNLLDASHREFGAVDDINAAEMERSIFGRLTWSF